MSSEVVKKRGRPKKVISDPVEVEMPEVAKKTTARAKSTKAGPKVVKTALPGPAKPPVAQKPASKPIASSSAPQKSIGKASTPPYVETKKPLPPTTKPAQPAGTGPISQSSSKILSKVRELSAKPVPPPAEPAKSSNPSPTTMPSKPSYTSPQPKAAPSPTNPSSNSIKFSLKSAPTSINPASATAKSSPPPPSAKPTPKPHIPIAALNSAIVSNITTRAGAKPNVGPGQTLPKNYKPVARKITMAIVALPIAIVTSYVLYQRLVLGEDRKLLVKPGLTLVDAPADGKSETVTTQ